MADRRQLEFFLLRYVPDAVKGEFVNFGVLTVENGSKGAELIDVRLTKDWGRVLCLDPRADLEMLLALQREIQQEVGQIRDRAALLRRMEDSFSGVVQISEVMPALTERTALLEIDEIARIFLESPKVRRTREPAGRQKILETMRDEFEKAGVLTLLNAVPAEPYTRPGDPFEFDFGYRIGRELRLFQAVSLGASVDSAVLLAARYPQIAEGMSRAKEPLAPVLTAVVDDGLDRSKDQVAFALGMMEENRIRAMAAAEMPRIAEVARLELKV